MIVKTIQDKNGNNSIGFNNVFKDLFKKESVLSNDDIDALKAYNAEIDRGTSPVTAYYRSLQNASNEAVNMAKMLTVLKLILMISVKLQKHLPLLLKGLLLLAICLQHGQLLFSVPPKILPHFLQYFIFLILINLRIFYIENINNSFCNGAGTASSQMVSGRLNYFRSAMKEL